MTSSITKMQSKKKKTKKEREIKKRKSFTIGCERNTQKPSAHSSSIHSQHIGHEFEKS